MHDLIHPSTLNGTSISIKAQARLDRFCRDAGATVGGTAMADIPGKIAELLPDLLSLPGLLTDAQRQAPADGYGRNTIFVCPSDMFSVLAMIWPPGVSTPIHDHRDWCALGVYEGEIEETRYRPLDETAECTVAQPVEVVRHRPGAVGHMPVFAPNIHRIHNPTDRTAISIHVYGGNCETLGPNLDKIYALQP